MSIAILYERSETDEMGIKLTATEMGINLVYIPFRKVSIRMSNGEYSVRSKGKDYSTLVKDVSAILNRAQSKNRRLFAAHILEAFGKHVINPSQVEYLCFSKLRTLLHFWKNGIKIPRTVYVPCDSHESKRDGSKIHNEEDIADLMQQELGNEEIVVKPDAGTHGKRVRLAKKREELLKVIHETKPSITNPIGVLAQELVQKWFYDLRIVVAKENRRAPHCYPKALARAGFKDFRTNTYLGNMVFGVNLPPYIKDMAIK
jgi:glutathione synthase/RimK-type ligase-like ATP-grasp enzyme